MSKNKHILIISLLKSCAFFPQNLALIDYSSRISMFRDLKLCWHNGSISKYQNTFSWSYFVFFLKIFATILSSLWETLISKNDMKHNGNILKKCLQNKYSVSSLIFLQLSILELDASILQKWARNAEKYLEYYWKNWIFKKHCMMSMYLPAKFFTIS